MTDLSTARYRPPSPPDVYSSQQITTTNEQRPKQQVMSLLFGSCNGLDALDPCAARSIVDALAFEDSNCYSGVSAMIKNGGMKGSSLLAHDDTFYDCLEYTEAEASDSVQYDIGTSPLMLRGGHSWNGKPLAFMSAKSVNESELDDRVRQRQQQPPPPPTTTTTTNDAATAVRESFDPPPPPTELPDRFLRAGKMDPVEGLRRYQATLEWRREQRMDHVSAPGLNRPCSAVPWRSALLCFESWLLRFGVSHTMVRSADPQGTLSLV